MRGIRNASNSARASAEVDVEAEVGLSGDRPDLMDGVDGSEPGALSVFLFCRFKYGAFFNAPPHRAFRGCGNSP